MAIVNVITGFLGAGKTTLANLLLRYCMDTGRKTVYIVNEFGKTGLDAQIVRHEGFDSVEISGGCICCSLKDDTVFALDGVIETYHPDHILFETSGVFIFNNFKEILQDEKLRGKCRLGEAITVVDSKNFYRAGVREGSFLYNQIRFADMIVVSKLSPEEDNLGLCRLLAGVNPTALIFAKPWSDLEEAEFKFLLDGKQTSKRALEEENPEHAVMESHTVLVRSDLTEKMFSQMKNSIAKGDLGEICRVKGVVLIDGKAMLVNGVYNDWKVEPYGLTAGYLTFIGFSLDIHKINSWRRKFIMKKGMATAVTKAVT